MPVVKLYANLRKLAGTKELSLAGGTVWELLNELVRKNPSLAETILKNGELAPHIVIILNGHNVIDMETAVMEQDTVAIFPPIAGGNHRSGDFPDTPPAVTPCASTVPSVRTHLPDLLSKSRAVPGGVVAKNG